MTRPITILIAALGGEGGGVLTQWIVEAALHAGYPVQSTSIPGVAQRTGATTYYVEIFPIPNAELGGRQPVLNLAPVAGCIDLLIASELLEATRAVQAGFVDPVRTTVITSDTRTLTTREKIAMGDGREDGARLIALIAEQAARQVAFDMNAEARDAKTVISAVMFGAVAGSGLLPFDRSHCEAAIAAGGRGVEASLDGFARGYARAEVLLPPPGEGRDGGRAAPTVLAVRRPELAALAPSPTLPERARENLRGMIDLGIDRMLDYQDARYASLYQQRVQRIQAIEDHLDPSSVHDHAMTREAARFLALWMAYDDVVRVADLKTRPDRYRRVRSEVAARPGDLVTVHDYFKPRLVDAAGLLPKGLANRLLEWEARRVRRGRSPIAFPLKLRSDSRLGRAALRLVAATRRWRPKSSRYLEEQAAIERWLAGVEKVATLGWASAHALVLCGRLIKGYGSTHARAHENMSRILDTLGSDVALTRFKTDDELASAIDSARAAALADPDGRTLDLDIARHGAAPRAVVARPMVFVRPQRS